MEEQRFSLERGENKWEGLIGATVNSINNNKNREI